MQYIYELMKRHKIQQQQQQLLAEQGYRLLLVFHHLFIYIFVQFIFIVIINS